MLDIYAYAVTSPIGIVRIPARRERELLAYKILGRLEYPGIGLCPGTPEEQKEALKWLLVRVMKIGSREFLVAGVFILPIDQIADIWTKDADTEELAIIFMKNKDKFTLSEDTTKALREYLNEL